MTEPLIVKQLQLKSSLEMAYTQYIESPSTEGLIDFVTLATQYEETVGKLTGTVQHIDNEMGSA